MPKIKKGQDVLLLEKEHSYLVRIEKRSLHIQGGMIELESLVGKPFGSIIQTHKGIEFVAVEPTTNDLIVKRIKRMPATIHFKDIGLILGMTGLSKHAKVLEAGTGTGQATFALSRNAKEVHSYEIREDFFRNAQKNFEVLGAGNIFLKNKDILEGISQKDFDLALLDMRNAERAVPIAYKALKPGGFLVVYSPYIEQVKAVVEEIEKLDFTPHKTFETIMRYWDVREHTLPKRAGMMHTAFITIARKFK